MELIASLQKFNEVVAALPEVAGAALAAVITLAVVATVGRAVFVRLTL